MSYLVESQSSYLGFAHFLVQCHVGTADGTGRGKGSGKSQHNEDDESTEHLFLYENEDTKRSMQCEEMML